MTRPNRSSRACGTARYPSIMSSGTCSRRSSDFSKTRGTPSRQQTGLLEIMATSTQICDRSTFPYFVLLCTKLLMKHSLPVEPVLAFVSGILETRPLQSFPRQIIAFCHDCIRHGVPLASSPALARMPVEARHVILNQVTAWAFRKAGPTWKARPLGSP